MNEMTAMLVEAAKISRETGHHEFKNAAVRVLIDLGMISAAEIVSKIPVGKDLP